MNSPGARAARHGSRTVRLLEWESNNDKENPMGPLQAHRLIPIATDALQPGMYVAELDRSWLHSPFAGAGFAITGQEQIDELRQTCKYVYVDPALSEPSLMGWLPEPVPADPHEDGPVAATRRALDHTLKSVATIVRVARRQGVIDLESVSLCATQLVERAVQYTDLLHWFLRTDNQDCFLVRRSVGTAAVAVTLGRHLGFDRPALRALATGGLLLDIGKIAVPVPILAKPAALDFHEQHYVRRHVDRGLALVAGRDLPSRAIEMMAGHHERADGSGYPHGQKGSEIPLFGRIAALADTFDALTLNRRYAAAISPNAALRQLDALREAKFDAALVTELILAFGVYPVGTLVELTDGRVGLVCGQRPREALHPHVVLTHDARRHRLPAAEVAVADEVPILRALPPRAVDIDAAQLMPALRRLYRRDG